MSLMNFQKKLDRGVGGWVELYPNLFWIFGIFSLCKAPNMFNSHRLHKDLTSSGSKQQKILVKGLFIVY